MSIPPVNCHIPSEIPATEPVIPASERSDGQRIAQAGDEQPLTPEARRQKMKEANTRYTFDQLIASVRRHNQEMQRQLQEQKEEDARNGYA